MAPPFQFRLRDALLATTLAAVWLAMHGRYYDAVYFTYRPVLIGYCFLYTGLPAMAVCTLFGRLGLGALAGVASGIAGVLVTDVSNAMYF